MIYWPNLNYNNLINLDRINKIIEHLSHKFGNEGYVQPFFLFIEVPFYLRAKTRGDVRLISEYKNYQVT